MGGSGLLRPKAAFFKKKIDNKIIFNLNCQERSQGTTFKNELSYMFNGSAGKWDYTADGNLDNKTSDR